MKLFGQPKADRPPPRAFHQRKASRSKGKADNQSDNSGNGDGHGDTPPLIRPYLQSLLALTVKRASLKSGDPAVSVKPSRNLKSTAVISSSHRRTVAMMNSADQRKRSLGGPSQGPRLLASRCFAAKALPHHYPTPKGGPWL